MIRKTPLTAQEAKVGLSVYYIQEYGRSARTGVETRITHVENIGELCCIVENEIDFIPLGHLFPVMHSPKTRYMMPKKKKIINLSEVRKSNSRLKLPKLSF